MNPQIDAAVLSYVIKYKDLVGIQQAGITVDHFIEGNKLVWNFLVRMKKEHNALPSASTVKTRFPDLNLQNITKDEIGFLVSEIKQRKKFFDFLDITQTAIQNTTSWESINDVIPELQGKLNALAYRSDGEGHLVDLFSGKTQTRILEDLRKRRSGEIKGIPTGFTSLDRLTGGLQPQTMVTIMGRTGKGKSWMDLYAIAHAVIAGKKAVLYPLEMQLTETAYRLYAIFNYIYFGGKIILQHQDLVQGRVTESKMQSFLDTLESEFGGKLIIADIGALRESYTIERIEAEVEIQAPDIFWVDYLTLMRVPGKDPGWEKVGALSSGIKNIAVRANNVGGCSAQVNREALKANVFIPRTEHVSYGDSIGQDSDLVISMNRMGKYLYWALVKARNFPEIGRRKVLFDVNNGALVEQED